MLESKSKRTFLDAIASLYWGYVNKPVTLSIRFFGLVLVDY